MGTLQQSDNPRKARSRRYYLKHKERIKKVNAAYRRAHVDQYRAYGRKHDQAHRLTKRRTTNKRRRRNKIAALTYYGKDGRMQCCWRKCLIRDIDMLSIDHINNDGARHRKKKNRDGVHIYCWLVRMKFPDGFQTLCFNHQMKKEARRRYAS